MVVLPCETGKSVMKSMAMCDQGHCGVGSGCSSPAGGSLEDFAVAEQVPQQTYCCRNTWVAGAYRRSVPTELPFLLDWAEHMFDWVGMGGGGGGVRQVYFRDDVPLYWS